MKRIGKIDDNFYAKMEDDLTHDQKIAQALREIGLWEATIVDAPELTDALKSQGLVIVPREPTRGMVAAFRRDWGPLRNIRAAIAAYEEEQ